MKKYRWGIIGLGDIATQFAAGFASDASDLYGVCARRYSKVKHLRNVSRFLRLMNLLKQCWLIHRSISSILRYQMISTITTSWQHWQQGNTFFAKSDHYKWR